MRAVTHDLLSREATDWHQQGLIDRPLLDLLLQRYARRGEFLATLLKWLGIFAILQLGLAVLASIAFLLNSAFVAAALLGATSVGPVSYTHLDVYKRQGESRGLPRFHPSGGYLLPLHEYPGPILHRL